MAIRQQGIGSMDVAAVGLHPFKPPLALWLEKTGRIAAHHEGLLYWGRVLELLVVKHYSQQYGTGKVEGTPYRT